MAVTLINLIKIAPFPEEQKSQLIEKIDLMTDQDKFEITNAAWQALAIQYFGRLKTEHQRITEEAILKKRPFNTNDYSEIEAKITYEFAQKLEAAESKDLVDEVRQQLEKFKEQKQP